jgi:hypothetical protein
MRTTVDINEPLLRRARVVAIETGRTLGEVVEDALRLALERVEREVAVPPLPVARASALVEGADLSPRGLLLADEDLERCRSSAG